MRKSIKLLFLPLILGAFLTACSDDSSGFDDCSDEDTSLYGDCQPADEMSDDEIQSELEDMVDTNLNDK